MRQRLLLLLICVLSSLSAFAFERPFPDNVKRGSMATANYPAIVIDGKQRRLSSAARIWNSRNTIDMPNAIPAGEYVVNYTEDFEGAIDRVWILTPQEISKRLPKNPSKQFQ